MTAAVKSGSRGFTLLETLVAVAILGALLAVLGQSVRFGVEAAARQWRSITAREDAGAVDRLLRGLMSAIPPGTTGAPPTLRGSTHAMEFRTVLPASVTGMRSASVALAIRAEGRLVLRMARDPVSVLGGPGVVEEQTLINGLERLDISYFRQTNGGGEWATEWSEAALPGLIRIHFLFTTNAMRVWPDIVAAPIRDSTGS